MNLMSFCIRWKLFSIIFLILITGFFIQFSDVFSRNERTDTENNTNSPHESFSYATISVNGDTSEQMISYVKRDQNILINAHLFCDIVGGQYFPLGQNYGLTVQYGKIISFAAIEYQYGFVAFQMTEMLPPAEKINDTTMAPINFLAQAVDGDIVFDDPAKTSQRHLGMPLEPDLWRTQ